MRKYEDGLGILGKWVYNTTIFQPCPYIWKGENFHSSWSLEISNFPKFLAKIRLHQDLHINCWDFCLMKK
jgi:hypothetical protein